MMRIMEEPDFKAGRFDTSYLEAHPELFDYEQNLEPEDLVALTVEAAAMAQVPLAGTDWIPGQGGY